MPSGTYDKAYKEFITSVDPGKYILPPIASMPGLRNAAILSDAAAYMNRNIKYFRIRDLAEKGKDTEGKPIPSNEDLVGDMEAALSEGYPIAFSFRIPNGRELPGLKVEMVYNELVPDYGKSGGHAVVAVGYDRANGGRFLILNSWGEGWGQNGYFYLPYSRFQKGTGTYKRSDGNLHGQADDIWVIKAQSAIKSKL